MEETDNKQVNNLISESDIERNAVCKVPEYSIRAINVL